MQLLNIPDSYVKLATTGQFAAPIMLPEKPDLDESRMSLFLPFADGSNRDGGGDVTEVTGIVTDRHRLNPICLYDHGKHTAEPVGLSVEWDEVADKYDTNKYTLQVDPVARTAGGTIFFYRGKGVKGLDRKYDHALFCEQAFHMLATGLIRGGSFGYLVIDARPIQADYTSGKPQGLHLLRTLLLEYGPTVLPMNQDTVRKCLSPGFMCCGKGLCQPLAKSLSAFAVPVTKTQVGFADIAGRKSMCKCANKSQCKCQKSQIPGDLQFWQEEQQKAEHKEKTARLKSLRKKYRKAVPVPHGDMSRTDVPPPHANQRWTGQCGKKYITRNGSKWIVHAESGKVLGTHDSKEKAEAQLRAVEANKSLGGARYPGPGKTKFPKVGDRVNGPKSGKVVHVAPYSSTGADVTVEFDDGTAEVLSNNYNDMEEVSPGKWKYKAFHPEEDTYRALPPTAPAQKAMSGLRTKYRSAHGLVKRTKRSSTGRGLVYVHDKDISAMEEKGRSLGLKMERVGYKDGLQRVRLSGDDGAIDDLARTYGRKKSMQGQHSAEWYQKRLKSINH